MEKFGIFNLISALTSFMGGQTDTESTPPEQQADGARAQGSEPAHPQGGIFTAEQRAARCTQILERHERISRGIDKKNKI